MHNDVEKYLHMNEVAAVVNLDNGGKMYNWILDFFYHIVLSGLKSVQICLVS